MTRQTRERWAGLWLPLLLLTVLTLAQAQVQVPPPAAGGTLPQPAGSNDQAIVPPPVDVPVIALPSDGIAVPVQDVPSPAAPDHAKEQLMWGLVAVFLLQSLKKTGWFPWLTEQTAARVKAQWGFFLALFTAFGVRLAITGSILNDQDGATITISGLSWDVIKDVAWQWASQQAIYKTIVKDTAVTLSAPVINNAPARPS